MGAMVNHQLASYADSEMTHFVSHFSNFKSDATDN